MLSNYMTLKKEKHYKKDKLFYKKQMGNNKDNKIKNSNGTTTPK